MAAENPAFPLQKINYILKYIKIENIVVFYNITVILIK